MPVLLTLIPHLIGFGEFVDSGKRYKYLWQFIYEFFYCIFAIGLVEEFVFRGFIFEKIKRVAGSSYYFISLFRGFSFLQWKSCTNGYDSVYRSIFLFLQIKD